MPLASFGGGDGWLAPGDRSYLTSVDNNQRGLAYNPTTGHLLLVNRTGGLSVNVLDGTTGDDVGTLDLGTGVVTGGTFAGDMIGVGDDGAIYMANLTTDDTGSPFKIYRWANESATPTLAYSGAPLAGARIGDSFDVIGSGTSTELVAGYYNSPSVTGNNSFAIFTTGDGTNFNATHVDIATAPPNSGDFRIGITFRDSDTVMGSSTDYRLVRIADVAGSTGTLASTFATEGAFLNPMDFAVVENKPLLATVSTSDSRLFIYDITEPYDMANPNPHIAVSTALPFHNTNINATGQAKFGAINFNTAILYALDTNNGIQAFTLTLDIAGDYNGDGKVDAADYVLWRKDPGSYGDDPGGYDTWRMNFGNPPSGGASLGPQAVPEPGMMVLTAAALGLISLRRRR